jgi:hypothetical protein
MGGCSLDKGGSKTHQIYLISNRRHPLQKRIVTFATFRFILQQQKTRTMLPSAPNQYVEIVHPLKFLSICGNNRDSETPRLSRNEKIEWPDRLACSF